MTKQYLFDGQKTAEIIPTGYLWDNGWNWLGNGTSPLSPIVRRRYETVGLLYACTHIRAKSLKKVPWSIVDDNDKVLWKRGDPPPDKFEFLKKLPRLLYKAEAALCLGSEAYIHKERNRAKVTGLKWLAPALVQPHWNEDIGIDYFDRKLGARNLQLPLEDVIYLWYQHPLFETVRDASPAEASMLAVNVLYNVDLFTTGFFERGAIKAMILGVTGNPRKDEMDRIKAWWNRSVNGIRNAFRTEVVNADTIKPVVVGEGLSELTNLDLTTEKRNDIAITMGIPLSMVFSDAANYATASQDEKNFYNSTVIPDCEIIAEQFDEQLLEEMGCHLIFTPSEMELFQTDEGERITSFKTLVDAGVKQSIAVQMVGLILPDGVEPKDLDPEDKPMMVAPGMAVMHPDGTVEHPNPNPAIPGNEADTGDEPPGNAPSSRRALEAKKFKSWVKKRKNPNIDDFESEVFSELEKLELLLEVKGKVLEDA